MQFKVPKEKDSTFTLNLFSVIEENLVSLKIESRKWPDRVVLSGPLGKEIHEFIKSKDWKLEQFNFENSNSPVNKIVFEFSKPIDQIEDRGATIFEDRLSEKKISGIPGRETVSKILSTYAQPAFKIEKKIRPKRELILIRL